MTRFIIIHDKKSQTFSDQRGGLKKKKETLCVRNKTKKESIPSVNRLDLWHGKRVKQAFYAVAKLASKIKKKIEKALPISARGLSNLSDRMEPEGRAGGRCGSSVYRPASGTNNQVESCHIIKCF